MRYQIVLSYDGSDYCGWQYQPRERSVQQVLEEALSTLLRTPVSVTGAGRTDTGVNAAGYVAHFDVEPALPDPAQLAYRLNALLPSSVVVTEIRPAAPDFHARFQAREREYTYFLNRKKDPFVEKFSYRCTFPLDFEAMNTAAAALLGTHDFSCFEKTGGDNKTSICTVTKALWEPYTPVIAAHPACHSERPSCHSERPSCHSERPSCHSERSEGIYWRFTICADRFLRNMVRAIVGTLLEVGRGRRTPEEFARLVGGGTRSQAGESVPGHALFLSRLDY
ncbi:MAG: tRNA pseudouridine(38-40) synthase TruA [Bacteroidales bacterium]|nr:tRNA pseudouridine(38-40) synthase TruA [Bacteroidales bacterium]